MTKKTEICPSQDVVPPAIDDDILDFTPEQWAAIKEWGRQWEDGFVPTSSLLPGTGI
ncbi:hypothetical protein [Pseudoxanthomonas kalamensis]|uniref:hypothetical protein n=1 Tax=Pseudoxanthomonas kalamensis TaxID=289483 RepID=UPI001391FD3F|nr:hypothetical protein [Pseudoxanthomonas kalamensis]